MEGWYNYQQKISSRKTMTLFYLCLITFVLTVPYCSIFEWTLHRFVMHKAIGGFDYAFKAHAVVHHGTFKSDETYHLVHEKDKHLIPMAWWNSVVLVLVGSMPALFVGWKIGHSVAITLTAALTMYSYYGVYELSHWAMHLPRPERKRLIEKCLPFRWLNGHHILHHRYMHSNFNVVLPLADFCFGTLVLRSKIPFRQPTPGPLIPDVQPRNRRHREELIEI